jgi:hypothetical protein
MRTLKLALLATVIAATPMAAFAQDVGATIYGNDGNPIGTVEQANDQVVVIDTGKHKAPVGANMIYESEAGPSVNTTKAQIEAMIDKQLADAATKRDAALVEGAAVVSVNGNPAGKLKSVDMANDAIILQSPTGLVAMKKEHFSVSSQGQLMALFTREQIAITAASATAGGGAQ